MTVSTLTEARDAIYEQFTTVWNTLGSPPQLRYANKSDDTVTGDLPWADITVNHNFGEQSSLGEVGCRYFTHSGVVTVSVFTPPGDGSELSDTLVEHALSAFEGVALDPTGIWFRNARVVEIGQNRGFYQVDVVVEFRYDRVK